mgnify:CR=1 FL=1
MSLQPQVTIDLAALRQNFALAKRTAAHSKIMAVIKADAYGHGVLKVASALSNADGFAVARLDEAIKLRRAGINKQILVLTGFSDAAEISVFSNYDVDAVLHCESQLEWLESCAGIKPLSIWLKINTGMNRLGIEPTDLQRISDRLQLSAKARLPYKLMTHLACADDISDQLTDKQIQLFDTLIKGQMGEQSITNSAGLLSWQYAQRHWVRPGIMLYGGSPFIDSTALDEGLLPVMTFKSRVIALRAVRKGQCVGYGSSWQAQQACLIATIAVGYGDGYPRHAEVGTPVLINGQDAPLVGRVSMDSINVDVTELSSVRVGDAVILWGEGLPIERVAEKSTAISYELMCGITARVNRVYK